MVPDDDSHVRLLIETLYKYLTHQTFYQRDNTGQKARLAAQAWSDALWHTLFANVCQEQDAECVTFFPPDGVFDYYPGDINQPDPSVPAYPDGWQTGDRISGVPWAEAPAPDEVYSPVGDNAVWLDYFQGVITLDMPRIRFAIEGEGVAEVHLLKVFQGGSCILVPDSDFSRAQFTTLSLGNISNVLEDLISAVASAFTQKVFRDEIVEVFFKAPGTHTLDMYFLPYIDVDNPVDPTAILSLGVGGGLRKLVWCGESVDLELRQKPSDPCILEYRKTPSADWSTAFDYSLCDALGGGGTGGDAPLVSVELEIQTDIDIDNSVTSYNSDPGTYAPELDTWTADDDALLCLAIELYIAGAVAAKVEAERGEQRRNILMGVFTAAVVGSVGILLLPTGLTLGLAGALVSTLYGVSRDQDETADQYIARLQNAQAQECVREQMYASLAGDKPSRSDFQSALDNPFPDGTDAEAVRQLVDAGNQGLAAFVEFLDFLVAVQEYEGLVGNDCSGDDSDCRQTNFLVTFDGTGYSDYEVATASNSSFGSQQYGTLNSFIGNPAPSVVHDAFVPIKTDCVSGAVITLPSPQTVSSVSADIFFLQGGSSSPSVFIVRYFDDAGVEIGDERITFTSGGVWATQTQTATYTNVKRVEVANVKSTGAVSGVNMDNRIDNIEVA